MDKHIKDLQDKLKADHKDIAKYTQHAIKAIDQLVDQHRRIVASNALAGIKPVGERENAFHNTMKNVQGILVDELEKTVSDLNHLGDKYYEPNYPDGVTE